MQNLYTSIDITCRIKNRRRTLPGLVKNDNGLLYLVHVRHHSRPCFQKRIMAILEKRRDNLLNKIAVTRTDVKLTLNCQELVKHGDVDLFGLTRRAGNTYTIISTLSDFCSSPSPSLCTFKARQNPHLERRTVCKMQCVVATAARICSFNVGSKTLRTIVSVTVRMNNNNYHEEEGAVISSAISIYDKSW